MADDKTEVRGWRGRLTTPIVLDLRRFDPVGLIQAERPELAAKRRSVAIVSYVLSALAACAIVVVALVRTGRDLQNGNREYAHAAALLHQPILLRVVWNWPVVVMFIVGWVAAAALAVAGAISVASIRDEPVVIDSRSWRWGRVTSSAASWTCFALVIFLIGLAMASPRSWLLICVVATGVVVLAVTMPAREVLFPVRRMKIRPDRSRPTFGESIVPIAVGLLGMSPWLLSWSTTVLNGMQRLVLLPIPHHLP